MVWRCVCIGNVNVAVRDDAENRLLRDSFLGPKIPTDIHVHLVPSQHKVLMSAAALLKPAAASGQSSGTCCPPQTPSPAPLMCRTTPAARRQPCTRPHGVMAPEEGRDKTDRAYLGNMYFRSYAFPS